MAGDICYQIEVHAVTKSFPSSGISFLQPPPHGTDTSQIAFPYSVDAPMNSPSSEQATSKQLKYIHMCGQLMEDFLDAASDNTKKDLETCGVLGAFLKDETFYVTTLIIPKQEATSNSCQASNEEEIHAIQNEGSLFPIGWIHVMVPEAVGIVVAPTDESRKYGIFRLTDPVGMNILKECQKKGFHTHNEPDNGSPIYEESSNIIFNPNLRLEIRDLR